MTFKKGSFFMNRMFIAKDARQDIVQFQKNWYLRNHITEIFLLSYVHPGVVSKGRTLISRIDKWHSCLSGCLSVCTVCLSVCLYVCLYTKLCVYPGLMSDTPEKGVVVMRSSSRSKSWRNKKNRASMVPNSASKLKLISGYMNQ